MTTQHKKDKMCPFNLMIFIFQSSLKDHNNKSKLRILKRNNPSKIIRMKSK